MTTKQGDVKLLDDPAAQVLLHSRHPAHLAYHCSGATPRVVPIWLLWNGSEIVLDSPPTAPKVEDMPQGTRVALSIDDGNFPYHSLLIRGTARSQEVPSMTPEYPSCAIRSTWNRPDWCGLRRKSVLYF